MLARERGLFAERGGEAGEVFSQTGIDLPRVFLRLHRLPPFPYPTGQNGVQG